MSEAVPPSSNPPPVQQPVTPPTTPPQTASGEPVGRGVVLQLPPNTPPLASGERLEGVVSSQLAASRLIISTRLGPVTVQTSAVLPPGSPVLLQTTSEGRQPTIQLATPALAPPPASKPIQPIPTTPGSSLTPASGQPTTPTTGFATPAPVLTDSQTQVRGSIVSATVLRVAASSGETRPQQLASQATGAQTSLSSLQPGARLNLRIAAVSQPGTGAAPAPPGTAAITGTVTGTDITGNALVRTNLAELSLATPRPLPTGSNLLLQTIGRPELLLPASATPHSLTISQRWEALYEALRIDFPAPTQAAISQAIPQPGAQFTGALLFFIAALRAGDLRGWLGPDASRAIDREALLGRMVDEFGVMQRIASEPAGQDWRLFLLPVLSDEQLQQMRLFIRNNNENSHENEKAKETRFVIEVTFSRLGPFQFDGLARPNALDLIIRTEQKIATAMRREIETIFTDTTAALGLNGSVAFRREAFFELQPLRDSGLAHEEGVIA